MEVREGEGNGEMRRRYMGRGEGGQGGREGTVLTACTASPRGARCPARRRPAHRPAPRSVRARAARVGGSDRPWRPSARSPALFLLPPAGHCRPGRGHTAEPRSGWFWAVRKYFPSHSTPHRPSPEKPASLARAKPRKLWGLAKRVARF